MEQSISICRPLAAVDHRFYLLAGVCNRHLVEQKAQADIRPVIVGRIVDTIAYGDDAKSCIPQVFQFYQSTRVTAGETREVLYDPEYRMCRSSSGRIS